MVTRGEDGWSTVTRLVDFPDYFEVAGQAPLGDRAVADALRPGEERAISDVSPLAAILGS